MGDGQKLTLKAVGLYTQPNQLGETPEGAMSVADNVDIQRDGVVEPRLGLSTHRVEPSFDWRMVAPYKGELFTSFNNPDEVVATFAVVTDSDASPDPSSGVTTGSAAGYLPAPDGTTRSANSAGALFFTSSTGVKQIEASPLGTVYDAGIPAALDPVVSLGTANGYAILGNSQYAYRVVWGRRDALGNVQYGAPSGRAVLQSASMPAAVGGSVRTLGTTVTVTTTSAHGLTTGEWVDLVIGATGTASFAAGSYQVTVTGASTFTYAEAGINGASTIALTYQRTTRDATVLVPLPVGATTAYFFQVYRSASSGGSDIEADDSLALVYEGTHPATATVSTRTRTGGNLVTVTTSAAHGLTSTQGVCLFQDVTDFPSVAVRVTVTGANTFTYADAGANVTSAAAQTVGPLDAVVADSVPDSISSQALYTNPEQQTISQSNDIPPVCSTLAEFRGALFFGNVLGPYSVSAQLIDVDSANGLQDGDQFAFTGGPNAVARLSPVNIGSEFRLTTTAAAGSTAVAIEATARALCATINYKSRWNYYRGDVYSPPGFRARARYVSTPDDPPGKFVVAAADAYSDSGTISSARGGAFLPNLYWGVASTRDARPNRLAWSKPNEPWAVPALNFQDLGARDADLLSIVALRDSAFVFKEDGIWRVTGDGSNWQIAPFDPTVRLLAPRAACALSNAVYAWTNQGIVQITDTGVTVVSRPVDDLIQKASASLVSSATARASVSMVGFESDRSLRVFLDQAYSFGGATGSTVLEYNLFTRAWRSHSFPGSPVFTAACVSPYDDRLYMASNGYLRRERKRNASATDYYEVMDWRFLQTTVNGAPPTTTSVTLASAAGVSVGDCLRNQSTGAIIGSVTAVNASTVTLDRAHGLSSGNSVDVYYGITSTWQWSAKVGNPGALHRFREASLLTQLFRAASWLFSFRSNLATSATTVTFAGDTAGSTTPLNRRTYVPRDQHYGHQMDVKCQIINGGTTFQVNGVSLIYNVVSPRLTR